MDGKDHRPENNEPSLAEQASPRPAPPTPKEREQISDGQKRAKADQEELRKGGFGDHIGAEGF